VRIKNAVEHLDYELRQLWLFAPSWAGDIEQVDDVIVQESFQPLRCVWQPDWPPETILGICFIIVLRMTEGRKS
jgi:hypothetical protein